MRSMMITVQDEEGRNFELDVQTDWYIDDIRDQIHRLSDIVPEKQNLSFNGKPVKEELTLINQGIVHASTLILQPMMIYVNISLRKKPVPFFVNERETIDSIKQKAMQKIKKQKATSSRNFCLMLGGQELLNSETLKSYNIQHEDTLTLEVFKVRIMHWSGDMIELDGIKRNSTVASIKKLIHEAEGIAIDQQRLSTDGRVLRDGKTLEKEKVNHRSTLVLEPPGADISFAKADKRSFKASKLKKFKSSGEWDEIMPVMPDWKQRVFFFDYDNDFDAHVELVIMHWAGEKFTLENILLKRKVIEIKRMISKQRGIKKQKQIIKFNGKVLDDKRTLLDQNIGHRSVLVLESPDKNKISTPSVERLDTIFSTVPTKLISNIHVRVRHWNGETFHLSPGPNDYIDDLKDMIYDLKGISQEHLRLSFNGQATEDVMTLKEHGIADGSTLVLEPMQICVQLPSKKEPFALNVEMNQTISDVKKQLSKKVKLALESMCITFGGEELANSKTIGDYGIEHEDEVRLETFEIQIMHWCGENFSINTMSPKSTSYDLKCMIEAMQSIHFEQQVLRFKGKILNDVLRLKDQGVHHKAILILDEPPKEKIRSPVKEKVKLSLFNDSNKGEVYNDIASGDDEIYFADLRKDAGMYSSDDSRSSLQSSSTKSTRSTSTDDSFSSSKKKKRCKGRKEKRKEKKSLKETKKSKSDRGTTPTRTRERSSSSKGRRRRKDSKKKKQDSSHVIHACN